MKKNDKVMIYEDPETMKIQEGEAKLVSLEIDDTPGERQYWRVKFSDGQICGRWIVSHQEVPA